MTNRYIISATVRVVLNSMQVPEMVIGSYAPEDFKPLLRAIDVELDDGTHYALEIPPDLSEAAFQGYVEAAMGLRFGVVQNGS